MCGLRKKNEGTKNIFWSLKAAYFLNTEIFICKKGKRAILSAFGREFDNLAARNKTSIKIRFHSQKVLRYEYHLMTVSMGMTLRTCSIVPAQSHNRVFTNIKKNIALFCRRKSSKVDFCFLRGGKKVKNDAF